MFKHSFAMNLILRIPPKPIFQLLEDVSPTKNFWPSVFSRDNAKNTWNFQYQEQNDIVEEKIKKNMDFFPHLI